MSLKDIKKLQSEKGFTIVELLIVIVIIGILAAIVIVAYNGITQQAKGNSAKTNANSIAKLAETANAQCPTDIPSTGTRACSVSGYPRTAATLTTYGNSPQATAQKPTNVTIDPAALTASTNETTVRYIGKADGTGACIEYRDPTGAGSTEKILIGSAQTGITGTTPACS